MPGVPPQLAGRLTLSVRYVWTGDADEGARRLAPMRAAAPMLIDDVADKPYTAIDSVHTDPLDPVPGSEAAAVLTDFPAEAAEALLAVAGPGSSSPQILVEVRQMGGATGAGRRARQRVLLARGRLLGARRRYRGRARGPGPRPIGAGGPRAVDRRASPAELHLPRRGVARPRTTTGPAPGCGTPSAPTTRRASSRSGTRWSDFLAGWFRLNRLWRWAATVAHLRVIDR